MDFENQFSLILKSANSISEKQVTILNPGYFLFSYCGSFNHSLAFLWLHSEIFDLNDSVAQ